MKLTQEYGLFFSFFNVSIVRYAIAGQLIYVFLSFFCFRFCFRVCLPFFCSSRLPLSLFPMSPISSPFPFNKLFIHYPHQRVKRSMGATDVDVACPKALKTWRQSPSVTLYERLPMKIFILILLDQPCEVLCAPTLKSPSASIRNYSNVGNSINLILLLTQHLVLSE